MASHAIQEFVVSQHKMRQWYSDSFVPSTGIEPDDEGIVSLDADPGFGKVTIKPEHTG